MKSQPWSSPIGRLIFALAVFTFSFWALALSVFLLGSPGRSFAAATAARMARPGSDAREAVAPGAASEAPETTLCGSGTSYGYDTDADGFTWALVDGDGEVTVESGHAARLHVHGESGRPAFWFREDSEDFWVHDSDVVDEVERVSAPLREIGREMGKVGAEMGRHGARIGRVGGRLGALGARLALLSARVASGQFSGAERSRARAQLRELREEMSALQEKLNAERYEHARSQRDLSRRMSQLSARHQVVLRQVRVKVREIARRARSEGKAERPHANA